METRLGNSISHPSWYNQGKIEVIEFIEDKNLNFHLGNAVKYIARAGKKDPAKHKEDLEKAKWYLEREIETKFAMDPRRPNDMRPEAPLIKEVELSTPAPHFLDAVRSVKEIINEVKTKNRTETLLIAKGIIHDLFDSAVFEDWEALGDSIGNAIKNHPKMKAFDEWEDEKERKEHEAQANVEKTETHVKQYKKPARPKEEFIREQFDGEALS